MAVRGKRNHRDGSLFKEGAGQLGVKARARLERDPTVPWRAMWTDRDGKRRKKTLRGLTRKQAEAALASLIEAERNEGVRRRIAVSETPLKDLLGRYLHQIALNCKAGATPRARKLFAQYADHDAPPVDDLRSLGGRVQKLGRYLVDALDWLGWQTPTDIEFSRCSAYATKLASGALENKVGHISPTTIRQRIQALKSFCAWVAEQGGAPDPVARLRLPAAPPSAEVRVRRTLGDDDFRRLVEQAGENPDVLIETRYTKPDGTTGTKNRRVHLPHRDALWLLAGRAGLRRGEIGMLTPERVHLDGDQPHLTLPPLTKTKTARDVPLLPEVAVALRPLVAKTPRGKPLFPMIAHESLGGRTPTNIALVLRADLGALGIPFETEDGLFDVHALRKEFVTFMALRGVPEPVVAAIVGHRAGSKMTREVYTKIRQDDVYEQLRRARLAS